jgi:hypothetical protein
MRRILIGKLCAVIGLGALSLFVCNPAMAITKDECKASGGAWGQQGATEGDGYCYRTLVKPAEAGDVVVKQRIDEFSSRAKHRRRSIWTGTGCPPNCASKTKKPSVGHNKRTGPVYPKKPD